jgi:hypothetical protein
MLACALEAIGKDVVAKSMTTEDAALRHGCDPSSYAHEGPKEA